MVSCKRRKQKHTVSSWLSVWVMGLCAKTRDLHCMCNRDECCSDESVCGFTYDDDAASWCWRLRQQHLEWCWWLWSRYACECAWLNAYASYWILLVVIVVVVLVWIFFYWRTGRRILLRGLIIDTAKELNEIYFLFSSFLLFHLHCLCVCVNFLFLLFEFS